MGFGGPGFDFKYKNSRNLVPSGYHETENEWKYVPEYYFHSNEVCDRRFVPVSGVVY